MNKANKIRIDEVSQYYKPASTIGFVCFLLFWVNALLSFCMLFSAGLGSLQVSFIILVMIHFVLSQIDRFYLIPKAERMRRKQMISDAFGTTLSHEKTSLYYNNEYSPSFKRLGANTMENSLFSKEVVAIMLCPRRIITGCYIVVWILAFTLRNNNLVHRHELIDWFYA